MNTNHYQFNRIKEFSRLATGTLTGSYHPKIDVHVHFLPPMYVEALKAHCNGMPDNFPTPQWSIAQHLKFNQQMNIKMSLISLSSPHIYFGNDDEAARLARATNQFGYQMMQNYPDKFKLLASLPLPNVANSLKEIRYALNVIEANIFTLPTNTRGHYLGDPDFDPLMQVLNDNYATVVLHPNAPGKVIPHVNDGLPIPAIEFLIDTTRTVVNMALNHIFDKFPQIKFVIPHAGSLLQLLVDRLDPFLQMIPVNGHIEKLDFYQIMRHLYFDLAGFSVPRQLETLLQLTSVGHLMYGSALYTGNWLSQFSRAAN